MHETQASEDRIHERGLLTVPNEVRQLAVQRAEVIAPLAAASSVGAGAVEAAAAQLGVSRRQVYLLLRRWLAGEGVVSDLVPGRSNGGLGREQLPDDVEAVIREVLRTQYLTRQKKTTQRCTGRSPGYAAPVGWRCPPAGRSPAGSPGWIR